MTKTQNMCERSDDLPIQGWPSEKQYVPTKAMVLIVALIGLLTISVVQNVRQYVIISALQCEIIKWQEQSPAIASFRKPLTKAGQ